MDHCIACGRELSGQGELCEECQAQGHLGPAPAAGRPPRLMHEVTLLFIALNVVVFLLMVAMGAGIVRPLPGYVEIFGGNQGVRVMVLGEYWRLLMSNYVHIGVVHLLVNMVGIWVLGSLVELFFPRRDYVLLYTYTGVASAVMSIGLHPLITSAGASGAVFGLAGALLTVLKYGKVPLPEKSRTGLFQQIFFVAGINLALGLFVIPSIGGHVDNAGHLGGLLAGLLVGWVMGKHLDPSAESSAHRTRTWLLLWLGLVGFFWLVVRFWVR